MTGKRIPLSERVFAALTLLFPIRFRERFGQDMRELFHDQLVGVRAQGGIGCVARFWLAVVPSLVQSALLEHRDAWRARRRTRVIDDLPYTTRTDSVVETVLNDLRFAGRMLRKSPVFTAIAVLVISLGTGAVSTIYSAMNAVVLRPLPGTTDGTRLVLFDRRAPDLSEGASGSYRFYSHLRDRSQTLDGAAAWSRVSLSISTGGEGAAIYGNIVSGNYFSVLGIRPALGRFFAPEEDRTPLTHPVVVVSYSFWETRLGADPGVIGRRVTVNGHPYTLIGVAPRGFRGVFTPLKTDAWVPLMMQPQVRPGRDLADASWLWMFGRVRHGVTREAHNESFPRSRPRGRRRLASPPASAATRRSVSPISPACPMMLGADSSGFPHCSSVPPHSCC